MRLTHARRLAAAFAVAVALSVGSWSRLPEVVAAQPMPPRLSDAEYWKLVSELSEPNGNFRSENLLSNEIWFQQALGPLVASTRPGGAYLGVGPEQNFTYVIALKPSIAFVVDVRRGNLDLHLMYKALFEISKDRADFVSRLFSRKRPAGLDARVTASKLFDAFVAVTPSEDLYLQTLADIRNQLLTQHHFAASEEDLNDIQFVLRAFYTLGPEIRYSPIGISGGSIQPTYAELMAATDEVGVARGFLSSEASFAAIKDFEQRNLLVPIVGNFAGAKAIRSIGRYLKSRDATVSAFYVSNVEEYLIQDGIWDAFCGNVSALPLDRTSTFIRSIRADGPSGAGTAFMTQLRPMIEEVKACASARP